MQDQDEFIIRDTNLGDAVLVANDRANLEDIACSKHHSSYIVDTSLINHIIETCESRHDVNEVVDEMHLYGYCQDG